MRRNPIRRNVQPYTPPTGCPSNRPPAPHQPEPLLAELAEELTWEDLDEFWCLGPTPESRDVTPMFARAVAAEMDVR